MAGAESVAVIDEREAGGAGADEDLFEGIFVGVPGNIGSSGVCCGSDIAGVWRQSVDDGGVEPAVGGQESNENIVVYHLQDGVS